MDVRSFPPISTKNARALILGTAPSIKSLAAKQYYAHPHNTFWPIMGQLLGMPIETYAQRKRIIKSNNLALWDVLECCYRPGSLDSKITGESIVMNDFTRFFSKHPHISHVFFNGNWAEKEFMKRIYPYLPEKFSHIKYHHLPSTSPAHAGMKKGDKIKAWRKVLKALSS